VGWARLRRLRRPADRLDAARRRQGLDRAGLAAETVVWNDPAVRWNDFDLVLADELMPVKGGLDLLAALRADPRLASLPFILLSLFGAWGAMAHSSPLGISMVWDQRLGGVFMMATCAAVTIPIASRI